MKPMTWCEIDGTYYVLHSTITHADGSVEHKWTDADEFVRQCLTPRRLLAGMAA